MKISFLFRYVPNLCIVYYTVTYGNEIFDSIDSIWRFWTIRYVKDCAPVSIFITKKIGWCDDLKSKYYNKQIKLPSELSHERLYRKDNIYDIVCIINYNINPTIEGKGSAIFLHIAKKKYQRTKGCIALKKKHLMKLLALIKKNTKIKIT